MDGCDAVRETDAVRHERRHVDCALGDERGDDFPLVLWQIAVHGVPCANQRQLPPKQHLVCLCRNGNLFVGDTHADDFAELSRDKQTVFYAFGNACALEADICHHAVSMHANPLDWVDVQAVDGVGETDRFGEVDFLLIDVDHQHFAAACVFRNHCERVIDTFADRGSRNDSEGCGVFGRAFDRILEGQE